MVGTKVYAVCSRSSFFKTCVSHGLNYSVTDPVNHLALSETNKQWHIKWFIVTLSCYDTDREATLHERWFSVELAPYEISITQTEKHTSKTVAC